MVPSGSGRVASFGYDGATLIDEVLGDPADRHIVFLHGWGGNRESLRPIGTLFQNAYCVHLLDLPGFGDSALPPPDWNTVKYTDLVQQYLLNRIAGSVIVVGHSFGARVAVRLAARNLAQIRGVVLIAAPGLPAPRYSRARIRRFAISSLRRLLVGLRGLTGPVPLEWHTRRFGSKDYLEAGELRPVLVRVVGEDLTQAAREVPCPVLLLWGAEDHETPPSLAYRFQRLMNGRASLEILPHKQHHPYTGTGAHLCAFKIRSWLKSHGES